MPVCPYLTKDELCSIYSNRPDCCRNFPNISNSHAYCNHANMCDLDCMNCKDKCCNNIVLDESGDFIKSLSISCDACVIKWKK